MKKSARGRIFAGAKLDWNQRLRGNLHARELRSAGTGRMDGVKRFRIEPRDVPPKGAARRLGKTLAEFDAILPNLIARGFPKPDPDTSHFDLVAIDKWCDARHVHLFGGDATMQARDASTVVTDRIAAMLRETA